MQLPKNGYIKMLISLPRLKNQINKFDREHYWETGKVRYPLNKITNDIQIVGFKIRKTYRAFENS